MTTLCIPKEIKAGEGRVALAPEEIATICSAGHRVYVEENAGNESGFSDENYRAAGAIMATHSNIWRLGTVIAKVKELQDGEFDLVLPGTNIFLFSHFRGNPSQKDFFDQATSRCITAIPYEDLHEPGGKSLPLYEMSRCAGKLAALIGCEYMRRDHQGPGLLPEDMTVQLLGMGTVGTFAYRMLYNLGIRNFYTHDHWPNRGMFNNDQKTITSCAKKANLIICSAINPFFGPPKLITQQLADELMPGALIVDIAIDEGGNCEFSKPTTPENPIFFLPNGIRVYALPNLPGLVPRSSSPCLSKAIFPSILAALELKKYRKKITVEKIFSTALQKYAQKLVPF